MFILVQLKSKNPIKQTSTCEYILFKYVQLWGYLMHHDPQFNYLLYPINHLTIFHGKEKCYWKHFGRNQLIYLVWKIIFSSSSIVKFMHTFIKVIVNILLSSNFVSVIFMMHDIKLFANWFNSFRAYEKKKRTAINDNSGNTIFQAHW